MAVRSAQLTAGVLDFGTAGVTVVTCPAATTILVKRYTLLIVGNAARVVEWQLDVGSGALPLHRESIAALASVDHETWWVLEPGHVLSVVTTTGVGGSVARVSAHGAILSGVA